MKDNLKISLTEKDGGSISEIRVDGVVDTLTAGELEQVIDSLLSRDRYRILIDLSGVEYISSAGWGIFISHIRDIREADGDIKLVNMQPDVSEIFELLEFDNVLETYTSVAEAAAAFPHGGDDPPVAKPGKSSSVKKKESTNGKIALDEQVTSEQKFGSSFGEELSARPGSAFQNNLETEILCYIKSDPFAAISEIRNHLSMSLIVDRVSWWTVFKILRQHQLLRRKSRFRLAWGRI